MRSWLTEARRHAAEIHDVVQLAAGATAFAAVLVFITLSGRSQDDPIVRWMAEVGAMMVAYDVIAPAIPPKTAVAGTAASTAASSNPGAVSAAPAASLSQSAAALNALAFEPEAPVTAHRADDAHDIHIGTATPIRY